MKFEDSFFEGEERNGFYVSSMVKRVWAAQMEMLCEMDAICKRHNIEYFAIWGTLLGAIRHGGYIPWDDDLDIGMKRIDYERFMKIAPKELPQEYQFLTARNFNEWEQPFSRITNSPKLPIDGETLEKFHGCPYIVGIDIFPMDYIPNNKQEEDMWANLFRTTYYLARDWRKDDTTIEEKMQNLKAVGELCGYQFTGDKPYQQQLQTLADSIASMYWDTGREAKECTMQDWFLKREGFRFPVSCFDSMIRVPYENITIPVPSGYEKVLEVCFGEDYMTPKRIDGGHEYPYYRKQQGVLRDIYKKRGEALPEYLLEGCE